MGGGGVDSNCNVETKSTILGCTWETNVSNSVSTNAIISAGNWWRRIVCETDNLLEGYELSLNSLHCAWRCLVWQVVYTALWDKWVTHLLVIPGVPIAVTFLVPLYNRPLNVGQQTKVLEKVSRTFVLTGCRHRRKTGNSLCVQFVFSKCAECVWRCKMKLLKHQ
jgi:hypothetical protein